MKSFLVFIPLVCLFAFGLTLPFDDGFAAYLKNSQAFSVNIENFVFETLVNPPKLQLQGGSYGCAPCTVFLGLIMQYTEIHNKNIDDFIMNELCSLFSHEIRSACNVAVQLLGPGIIQALTESETSDQICTKIKLCDNPQCTLFSKARAPKVKLSSNWDQYVVNSQEDFVNTNPLTLLLKVLEYVLQTKNPMVDHDGDRFSTMAEVRGYHWRGRDCNDFDSSIYPGRKNDPSSGFSVDFDCNGIKGVDPQTGQDYEDLLCGNSTGRLGVVVIGDSAGIFAQIPNEWATAADWSKATLETVVPTLADQGGHPHFCATTGYEDIGYHGVVRSVYKYVYGWNKCNFRDYQNLAVSGASSKDTLPNAQLLSRDRDNDHPLLIIMELAANDVCFGDATTPDQFAQNIVTILDYLDTVVPPGSHLVSIGLVNGSLIHELTAGHTHPLGVTYDAFYDYLNCAGIELCPGYLTSNQTTRDATTAKAMALNQVYWEVFSNYTAKNFDFVHYDFPATQIIEEWTSQGGDPYDLISHVDGFHPSQGFNMLFGDFLWNSILRDHPEWVGEQNPNNNLIESLFGNQGGY